MEERRSIKDILVKSNGYDIALLTTYNFDVRFFERTILNPLIANNIRTVSVFADSKEFALSLTDLNYCDIGRRYIVTPVDIQGAFHPKVVLLLGENKARLIVGSANLTTAGYFRNNEVYNCIDYSAEKNEHQDVIVAAMQFFIQLNGYSYQIDSEVIRQIKEYSYYRKSKYNGKIRLIHNIEQSMINQVKEIVNEEIDEIHIAVPYYDSSLSILDQLSKKFDNPKLSLFIQNKTSTFPLSVRKKLSGTEIFVFEQLKDNKSNHFYHAKTIVFNSKNKSFVLYGSANCTKAALINTVQDGGNIECGFIVEGDRGEFDYYFDNFDIIDEPLISNKITFDSNSTASIYFKYGIIKDDLHLHFGGCSGVAKVTYEENILKSSYDGKELVAIIPTDIVDDLPDFFDVSITSEEEDVLIRCWWFDPEFIEEFRCNTSERSELQNFELDSSGDKYIHDRRSIIEAEIACLPDIKASRKAKSILAPTEPKENDEIDGEYYVDYEIPEEYNTSYKKQSEVEKIRQLYISRVINYYKSALSSKGLSNKTSKQDKPRTKGGEPKEVAQRSPTTEEESFERFIRRKLKVLLDPENTDIKEITTAHLFGLIQEFLDVFDKYKDVELFDPFYVSEVRVDLFQLLLEKDLAEASEEIQYVILLECYKAILNNYFLETQEKELLYREEYNYINKQLIDVMSKKYDIRVDYKNHIKALYLSEERVLTSGRYEEFENYIEKLFGYKDHTSLVDYINARYNCNKVEFKDTTCEIFADTENKRMHFAPDREILKEIRNYSNNVSRIDNVIISIETPNDNYVARIEHSIKLKTLRCKTDIYYINGNVISDGEIAISI